MTVKGGIVRKVTIKRKTTEVDISGKLNLDGAGKSSIHTGFEPLNHLLTVFAFHGLFDLEINAKGDLAHHIIEDIGIALGKAIKDALDDKKGINRYGSFSLVMDKVVVEVDLDISGRPSVYRGAGDSDNQNIEMMIQGGTFDNTSFTFQHAQEFLEALVNHAGISMVYIIKSGEGDVHHLLEALFKAFGKALEQAVSINPRRKGVPSTKGVID